MDCSTRVDLETIGLTEHGQRYRVTYVGETLVEGRRNPVFAACRALLARGITGRLEVWRPGKTSADLQLDIERGAGLTISETDKRSLQLVRWSRHPRSAVLYASGEPPAAAALQEVGYSHPLTERPSQARRGPTPGAAPCAQPGAALFVVLTPAAAAASTPCTKTHWKSLFETTAKTALPVMQSHPYEYS
jgi:hypothetical protein